MRTISDGKSRWLAAVLTVLGGSVLLSACSRAVPTGPDPDSGPAADLGTAEAGRVSALSAATILYCPKCYLLIDPVRVPPNKEVTAFLSMTNVGTEAVGNVHVTGYLLGADRERARVAEVDQAGPRPRETVHFSVGFDLPSRLPPGPYRVAMAFDPENTALPSYTWVSDDIVTVQ
jgi:hypothetical protein